VLASPAGLVPVADSYCEDSVMTSRPTLFEGVFVTGPIMRRVTVSLFAFAQVVSQTLRPGGFDDGVRRSLRDRRQI
jgi:hypothetical protein